MKIRISRRCMRAVLVGSLTVWVTLAALAMPMFPGLKGRKEPVKDAVGNIVLRNPRASSYINGKRAVGLSVPTQGNVRVLAIPVQFAENVDPNASGKGTFPYTWGPASKDGYLQGRLTALAKYYNVCSGGRVTLVTTLASTVTLPKPMSYYATGINTGSDLVSIITDTIKAGGTALSFANFDIVMLIHAGAGYELSGLADDIHSCHVFFPGGQSGIFASDGSEVVGYAIVPETECNDNILQYANPSLDISAYEQNPSSYRNVVIPQWWDVVGTWAHECGHAFGLPDEYDTNYDGGTDLAGWTLMSSGSYSPMPTSTYGTNDWIAPNDPNKPWFGSSPSLLDAWAKAYLGWTKVVNVKGQMTGQKLAPSEGTGCTIYRLWTNGDTTSKEYFLIENRERNGVEKGLPEPGLLIEHIDDTIGSMDLNDLQTSAYAHPRIYPEPAGGKLEPETAQGYPNVLAPLSGITYPEPNNTRFGPSPSLSNPNSLSWSGAMTYVDAKNIAFDTTTPTTVDVDLSDVAGVTFLNPSPNSTIYVTMPTIRALIVGIDPTTVSVSLDGQTISSMLYQYSQTSGLLQLPINATDGGPLAFGTHTIRVTGTNISDGTTNTDSMTFYIRQKILSSGLQMVCFPASLDPTSGKALNVFGMAWANQPLLAWYDTTLGRYRYFNSGEIDLTYPAGTFPVWAPWHASVAGSNTVLSPAGMGFWVDLTNNTPLQLNGDTTDETQEYQLPLTTGFNLIGNPYTFPVTYASLLVKYNGQTYSMQEAVDDNLISSSLYAWGNNGYTVTDLPDGELMPWQGYFVNSLKGSAAHPLYIVFQPLAPATTSTTSSAPSLRSSGSATNWRIDIHAACLEDRSQAKVTLGVRPGASDLFNASYDVMAPPSAPRGISFVSQENKLSTPLWADFRAPGQTTSPYSWNLKVSAAPHSSVLLTWPDLTYIPKTAVILLKDNATGAERYLRTCASYELDFGANETERDITLSVVPNAIGALQLRQLIATRRPGDNTVIISGQATLPAAISFEIRTMTGRLVRMVPASSTSLDTFTLSWDGKDGYGRPVPNGTYQCQVTATTSTGQAVKAVTLLTL